MERDPAEIVTGRWPSVASGHLPRLDHFPRTAGGLSHLSDSVALLARVVHLVEVLASPPVQRVYGRREGLPESRELIGDALGAPPVVVEHTFDDTIALEEPEGLGQNLWRDALDRLRELKTTPRSRREFTDDGNDPLSAEYREDLLGDDRPRECPSGCDDIRGRCRAVPVFGRRIHVSDSHASMHGEQCRVSRILRVEFLCFPGVTRGLSQAPRSFVVRSPTDEQAAASYR